MRSNNLDLFRLLAAVQVALVHATTYLGVKLSPFGEVLLHMIPGVPVFFAISGFLIYQSYQNAPKAFFRNRVLRIYPGLIVCFVVSVLAVYLVGYRPEVKPWDFARWAVAQLTFLQIYNPDFMRSFGVGVLNGSLWTIMTELQFYALTPLLYKLTRNERTFVAILVTFIVLNLVYRYVDARYGHTLPMKLFTETFVPWAYTFILGAYLSTKQHWIEVLKRYTWWLIALYAVAAYFLMEPHVPAVHPIASILLVLAVFSVAFKNPGLTDRLLRGHDISYGFYIYHMPVINVLVYLGLSGLMPAVMAVGVTVALAVASWLLVERPALRMKAASLRRV